MPRYLSAAIYAWRSTLIFFGSQIHALQGTGPAVHCCCDPASKIVWINDEVVGAPGVTCSHLTSLAAPNLHTLPTHFACDLHFAEDVQFRRLLGFLV